MRTSRVLPIIIVTLCCAALLCAAVNAQQADALAEARRQFDAGRYDEVLRLLNGATAQPGNNAQVNYLLGLAFQRRQDYARAAPFLAKVIAQTADTTREHREAVQALGMARYLLGHLAEAVPLLEKAAAWWPNNNEYVYALGMACIHARQPDKARAAFGRMFKVAPDSPAARLLTAQMMFRVEMEEFAEAELKQALAKDPRLPQAHYLLGQIAIYKGRPEEGLALLEKELAVNPGNANAHYKIGDAYTRLTRWDEAIAALQKAVWLNPFYSGPYILLGKSYLKKRELASAEGMLKRAIQFDPNNKSAHYLLAQVYQQSGRAEDAKREFAIAEKLQGSNDTPEK
jgi:tetratricopeptide (TPR) repeat protein